MTVEIVRAILEGSADVAAEVGERMYPLTLPDAPTYPALVLTQAAGQGEYDLEGDAGVSRNRVQVDVHHDGGYAAMLALRGKVRRALSGFRGSVDSSIPCQVQGIFCINDFDLTEPATERAGPRVRRRVLEFIVWNREA